MYMKKESLSVKYVRGHYRQFGTVVSAVECEADASQMIWVQFRVTVVNPLYSKIVLGREN